MVQLGIIKQEDLERDYEQMVIAIMREDFRGLMFILTAGEDENNKSITRRCQFCPFVSSS